MSHASHASRASHTSHKQKAKREAPTTNNHQERSTYMKIEIDWAGMLKAALKSVWPFIAGTVGGIDPNFL